MWTIRASIDYFFNILTYLIVARAISTWIFTNPYNNISKLLYQITEPIIAPFRSLLTRIGLGGRHIDFSPLVAIWGLMFIKILILSFI
ncbi:YggT family protein [Anaerosolibacter carboniphilus]|uniref:YggT family protein n=1 Tax=Anaerosolibacter carboniphilus TaxID=1417629 RepID=A0A841L3R1_9FIRM|nr:YggT family protein [Anaerosolibacter carboniphilus]MBB6216975.1 YggT family protein [Anaerosolibacter carboniphilus]